MNCRICGIEFDNEARMKELMERPEEPPVSNSDGTVTYTVPCVMLDLCEHCEATETAWLALGYSPTDERQKILGDFDRQAKENNIEIHWFDIQNLVSSPFDKEQLIVPPYRFGALYLNDTAAIYADVQPAEFGARIDLFICRYDLPVGDARSSSVYEIAVKARNNGTFGGLAMDSKEHPNVTIDDGGITPARSIKFSCDGRERKLEISDDPAIYRKRHTLLSLLYPFLRAIDLLNWEPEIVPIVVHRPNRHARRRAMREGTEPPAEYSTINIDLLKPRKERAPWQGGTHASPAFHYRRPHVAFYTKPLFGHKKQIWGKTIGLIKRSSAKVGNRKRGTVAQRYIVREPGVA